MLALLGAVASHALVIDKPGEGVRIPHTAVLEPKGDLTVEAWVRPSCAPSSGPYQFIVSKNYGGAGFALLMIGSGERYRFQFEASDTISYEMHRNVLKDNWFHVAGVLESGKYIKIYVNGIAVAYKPTTEKVKPFDGPLYIGTSPWDTFMGQVDDVMIWNEMRKQEDIIADSKKPPNGKVPNLIAFWDFERRQKGQIWNRTHLTRPGDILGKPAFSRVTR